jgi:copper transport protein
MPRRGLFLSVLASAFAGLAPSAAAHAVLVRSEPPDGSALARAPREMSLRFNEDISPRFRVVRLVDARGRAVAGVRVRSDGARGLALTVPRLPRGAYQLTWEVLAEDDGHVTGGALVFGVAARAPARAPGGPGTAPVPLEAALRWVDLTLLLGLIGALSMVAVLARAGAPPAARIARRRLLSAAALAAGGGLAVGVALLARQVTRLHAVAPDTTAGQVLRTRWGALWNARELLLAALLIAVLSLRRRPRGRRLEASAAVCVVAALAVVRALAGHAAADSRPTLAVAVAAMHVLAAGVWMGGVAAFGLALAAAGPNARELARACRTPFARVALIGLAALAVTGLVEAGAQVASVDALLTTDYGRTLITKCALVTGAVVLGLGNAALLRDGTLPRLLRAEVAIGLGIVLAAAVLSASPPAKGPEFGAPRPVVAPALIGRAGDLVVTATTRPNRPGMNLFTVAAASSRRPPPAPVTRLELLLARAGEPARTVALRRQAAGRFAGGAELDADGRWRMTAVISRGGRELRVPFRWSVNAPDPARPVVYSAQPLAPLLDGAAAVVLLALAAAVLTAAARRVAGMIQPVGKEAP